jgi:hypothetical protein
MQYTFVILYRYNQENKGLRRCARITTEICTFAHSM